MLPSFSSQPFSSSSQPLPAVAPTPSLAAIWQKHRGRYSDRLAVIERATFDLSNHTLTEALRQQAELEAHTLAGSLGVFGFDEAIRLSREIEQLFK